MGFRLSYRVERSARYGSGIHDVGDFPNLEYAKRAAKGVDNSLRIELRREDAPAAEANPQEWAELTAPSDDFRKEWTQERDGYWSLFTINAAHPVTFWIRDLVESAPDASEA